MPQFWPVEELMEFVDRPTGCGEVVRVGHLLSWNFTVASSTVLQCN
jgi:hypothetical protein